MEREWSPAGSRRDAKVEMTPARFLVLAYLGLILCGALLLVLPQATRDGEALPFIDALFTAASAVCVTGLTVVDPAADLSLFGQLVLLTLIQAGAVGILTISTFFLLLLGRRVRLQDRMLLQQDLNWDLLSGLVRLVRRVVATTLLIEAAGAALLYVFLRPSHAGSALYYAAFHAVSGFANAGFDLFEGGLEGLRGNWGALAVLVVLIEAGSIGFSVLQELREFPRKRRLSLHAKVALAATGTLLAAGTLLVLALEWRSAQTLGGARAGRRVLDAFLFTAAARTAGFGLLPAASLSEATLFALMGLMFIGASPGSTGGGIKTTTAAVLFAAVRSSLRGQQEVVLFRRRIPRGALGRALAVTLLSAGAVAVGAFSIALIESEPFFPILFEAVSAFSTSGYGSGAVSGFTPPSKAVLVLLMVAGRLGPTTFALALAGRAAPPERFRYPEERIPLG